MSENNNEDNNFVFIKIIILILFLYFGWWLWNTYSCRQIEEKHVRFSDDIGINDYIVWLKKRIKNIFFHSHIENGILKSRRYTSDSPYAEIFGDI